MILGHKLVDFLEKYDGDTLSAFKSIENTAQKLADQGKLSGIFDGVPISVDGVIITVKGRIMDGVAKISTAYIP